MAMSVVPCLLVELGVTFMGAGLRPTRAVAQQSFSSRALCHQGSRTDVFLICAAHRAKSPLAQKPVSDAFRGGFEPKNQISRSFLNSTLCRLDTSTFIPPSR